MKIHDLLANDLILLDMPETRKEEVIRRLVQRLRLQGVISDDEGFFADIMQRESMGSTAMGYGLAFPHARTDKTQKVIMAFGRLAKPADFGKEKEGKGVRMVFVLGTPIKETASHINILAALSRLVGVKKVRSAILSARTPGDVLRVISEKESEVDD